MFTPLLESASPQELARYRAGLRRHRRISSVALLFVCMPSVVLAGMIVARLGGLLGHWGIVVFLGLWLLSGVPVLLFTGAMEAAQPKMKTTGWTPAQSSRLTPAWRDVVEAAGISETDYPVVPGKAPDIQGSAGGGVVQVSIEAVRTLKRPELSALLAHELGHLLSSRRSTWKFVLGWYALPLHLAPFLLCCVLAVPAGFGEGGLLRKLAIVGADLLYLGGMVGLLVLLVGARHAPSAIALLTVQMLARRVVSRRDERMADLVAVDLGFGAGALALMREHDQDCAHGVFAGVDRLSRFVLAPLSTHPSRRRRIRAIESRIRARERAIN